MPKGFGGYTFRGLQSLDVSNGFLARGYVDGNQIVVAFRGTDTSNPVTLLKNLAADVSFGGSVPTPLLVNEVTDAANFLKTVERSNPNDSITLTGHSLGGGITQLLGEASGLDTYAFNAPARCSSYMPA